MPTNPTPMAAPIAVITAAGFKSAGSALRPEATSLVTYCSTGTRSTVARMKNMVQSTLTGANSSVPSRATPEQLEQVGAKRTQKAPCHHERSSQVP